MWILFLLLIGIIHSICCYLTFHEKFYDRWWFIPIGLFIGLCSNGLWFLAAKTIGNKDQLYIFSMFWDCLIVGIYFLFPVLFFGIKLDKIGIVGLCFIVIGTLIIKSRS
jgi:hypothetical protein